MKLNRPTLHTIHAVIWIAQHGDGAIVGGPAIAKAFGMVDEQMRAMLMVAARAGILVGIKDRMAAIAWLAPPRRSPFSKSSKRRAVGLTVPYPRRMNR